MNTPPFLTGAAVLFWGFETGWLVMAGIMAAVIESSRLVSWRWEFSDADLNRVWDLCAVLFLGAFILRYTSEDRTSITGAYLFFQWFPMLFFPMALGQAFGTRERIPLSVLSWFLRRRARAGGQPATAIRVSYLYVALCLLSASAANRRDLWFYAGLTALCGWGLWAERSRRFRAGPWIASFAVAVALGHLEQRGLIELQSRIEGKFSGWFARFMRKGFDPHESRTSMGQIGSMKGSGRILLRVRPEQGRFPHLLRQASYDAARQSIWLATRKDFSQVLPEADTTTWMFTTNQAVNSLQIFAYLPGGRGLLTLPMGSAQLENLPVATMETNALGAVRVAEGPGLANFRVRFRESGSGDEPPDGKTDLAVPETERPAVAQIVRELGLLAKPPAEKLRALEGFFRANFQYSLYVPGNLQNPGDALTPLAKFLLKTRAGHCEYFATATALLLREAGLPARYATGFSVQETARRGDTFLVRERHAHAWTLVWLDGAWREFDTTPGSWSAEEDKAASMFEPLSDVWSEIWFQFSKWRWLGRKGTFSRLAPWLLGVFVLALAGRLLFRQKRARRGHGGVASASEASAGADSEFYLVEQKLARSGVPRLPGETMSDWLARIRRANLPLPPEPVAPILALHYRHRFAAAGLSPVEREELRNRVREWLDQYEAGPGKRAV